MLSLETTCMTQHWEVFVFNIHIHTDLCTDATNSVN
jgi:hypothetical protein